jgi:hypothetical protein
MGRGIGNRQKKMIAPKKVWVKPQPTPKAHPLSRREREGVRGKQSPTQKT